jgi:hypothetical protein
MAIHWHHVRLLFTELQRPLKLRIEHDELDDFDARFYLIVRKHLAVLAWWSIINFVAGVFAFFLAKGVLYYFLMMGLVWGIINMSITMVIFDHTFYRKFTRGGSAYDRVDAQKHVDRLMFLNIGIDTAYIFVGLWLREHSFAVGVAYPDLWLGFGWSIIIQGLFLLTQDILVTRLHHINYERAEPYFRELLNQISPKKELNA